MDIEQSLRDIRDAVNVVHNNGMVLIYGSEDKSRKLYELLCKLGCLEGRTHVLQDRDAQQCEYNVVFKHSMHHNNVDVEKCTSAYVILPRTADNHEQVMRQFFHAIPLPNIVVPTGREVYALDYTNRTCKVFLM